MGLLIKFLVRNIPIQKTRPSNTGQLKNLSWFVMSKMWFTTMQF